MIASNPQSNILDSTVSPAMESRLVAPAEEQWDRIKEILNCPVCLRIFEGSIGQCSNGHSICEFCRKKLRRCPLCRANMSSKSRNFILESIVSLCTYKCPFFDQGCTIRVQGAAEEDHRSSCSFRTIPCTTLGFKECTQKIKFSAFSSHLSKEHHVRIEDNNFFEKRNVINRDLLIFSTTDRCVDILIKFDDKLFLVNFEILGNGPCRKFRQLSQEEQNLLPCTWWVSVLDGSREAAQNYSCRITVTSDLNSGKKSHINLSCEGPVTGFRDRSNQLLTTSLGNILGKFCPTVEDNLMIGVPEVRYKINAVIFKTSEPRHADDDNKIIRNYLQTIEPLKINISSEILLKLFSLLFLLVCIVKAAETLM